MIVRALGGRRCILTAALLTWSGHAVSVCPPDAGPATSAPYVSYRTDGDLVFVSGQIGVDPAARGSVPDFETQMRSVLARLDAVLEAAGSGPGEVLRATVYLADPADLPAMNRLYREYFEQRDLDLPARSLVPGLDFGNAIAVEIDVIARRRSCG